jgi:hypothetical protein
VCVTKELAKSWKNDVPWWYNERANLSVFAGGVWRSGGHAFEEFSGTKRKLRKLSGRLHGSYSGRVDMFFETRYGDEFYLEAKACEAGAALAGHDPVLRIKQLLKSACDDVRKIHPHGYRRLGVVFVSPYIRQHSQRNLQKQISDWLWRFEKFECDAMAWAFPLSFMCGKYHGGRSPGVVAFIKEVKR